MRQNHPRPWNTMLRSYCGCFCLLALASCSAMRGPASDRAAACTELATHPVELTHQGSVVYVQDQSLAAGEDEIVLAGTPTYLIRVDSADLVRRVVRDSIIAIRISAAGSVLPIVSPLPGKHLGWVRVAHVGASHFAMVFAELERPPAEARFRDVRAIWFGVYGPQGWEHLRDLGLATPSATRVAMSSELAVWKDSVAWALIDGWEYGAERIVVFSGTITEWSSDSFELPGAHDLSLTHAADDGLLVAVASSLPDRNNRLDVYRRNAEWSLSSGVSVEGQIMTPTVIPAVDGWRVYWARRGSVGEDVRVITSTTNPTVPRQLVAGATLWRSIDGSESIVHVDAGGGISVSDRDGVTTALTVPSPFVDGFQSLRDRGGRIWLVGHGENHVMGGMIPRTTALLIAPACR